jgi:hypothetical protein
MFKWTTAVLAGIACCFTLPALNAGTDMGCLPPPLTQDYLKKTVRVEIKGKLDHILIQLEPHDMLDPGFPMSTLPFLDSWQITVGGKTYTLDLGGNSDVEKGPIHRGFADDANKLAGKAVIVTGTLNGDTVQVSGLRADEDYVKQTTEVEVRGQLRGEAVPSFWEGGAQFVAWSVTVDGKFYALTFATPELEKLATTLAGKAVVLTGVLNGDTITAQTLNAAQ